MKRSSTLQPPNCLASRTRFPELLAQKSGMARQIGIETGLFDVPRIVGIDSENGLVLFERIEGLQRLEAISGLARGVGVRACARLGESLAAVHLLLRLPESMERPLPTPWTGPGTHMVCVHGDLTAANVCWKSDGQRLIIVDWATAPAIGEEYTMASRYFDVMWFLAYLFHGVPLRMHPVFDPSPLAEAFLGAYRAAVQDRDDQSDLVPCLDGIASLYPQLSRDRNRARSFPMRLLGLVLQNRRDRRWQALSEALRNTN